MLILRVPKEEDTRGTRFFTSFRMTGVRGFVDLNMMLDFASSLRVSIAALKREIGYN
jgi:hypothetical protein